MKMLPRLATLLVMLATSGPLLSATEVERLRALCAEQEMQIKQLELKIARLTDTPPPSRINDSTPSSEPASPQNLTYTVKAGDSIERIASRQGTSVSALNKINGLKTNSIIHPGQTLKIPGAAPAPELATATKTHTVASGDTLYGIARKHGVSVDTLIAANPGVDSRALRIGQTINISTTSQEIAKTTESKPAPSLAPAPTLPIANSSTPIQQPRAVDKPIKITEEVTYAKFAEIHNTTTKRLDELNGLELDPATILAQGSELYIPAQP